MMLIFARLIAGLLLSPKGCLRVCILTAEVNPSTAEVKCRATPGDVLAEEGTPQRSVGRPFQAVVNGPKGLSYGFLGFPGRLPVAEPGWYTRWDGAGT
jgi:hypothetical protein